MRIKSYEDMNGLQRDAMRELGSIGTAHAATALSELLMEQVKMSVPNIHILGYNETFARMGNPEEQVAGVMVMLEGGMNGMMLYIQRMELINIVMDRMFHKTITHMDNLGELERSALLEIGNIMISSYMNAISDMTGITIHLSVPAFTVNMLGGILAVPMVEMAYETDKIMTIEGSFLFEGDQLESNLLMIPEVEGLNQLLEKLGVGN